MDADTLDESHSDIKNEFSHSQNNAEKATPKAHWYTFLNKNPILWKGKDHHLVYFGVFAALNVAFALWAFGYFLYLKGVTFSVKGSLILPAFVFSAWLGARLFHLLALGTKLFKNPKKYLLETGFYVQGGIIAVVGALLLVAYASQIRYLLILDAASYGALLGLFFGRLGCLNYGCCYGKPANVSWAVKYHHPQAKVLRLKPHLHGVGLHPTQLYTAFGNIIAFSVISLLLPRDLPDGYVVSAFFCFHGCLRIFVEFFREDVHFQEGRNLLTLAVALGFIITGVAIYLFSAVLDSGSTHELHFTLNLSSVQQYISSQPTFILMAFISGVLALLSYGLHGKKLGSYA
jgi:prolipoprotein diacylglyceryltransferase